MNPSLRKFPILSLGIAGFLCLMRAALRSDLAGAEEPAVSDRPGE